MEMTDKINKCWHKMLLNNLVQQCYINLMIDLTNLLVLLQISSYGVYTTEMYLKAFVNILFVFVPDFQVLQKILEAITRHHWVSAKHYYTLLRRFSGSGVMWFLRNWMYLMRAALPNIRLLSVVCVGGNNPTTSAIQQDCRGGVLAYFKRN